MDDFTSLRNRSIGYELPVNVSASSSALGKRVRIIADPEYIDKKACAHLINDCGGPGLSDDEYKDAVRGRMNCEFGQTGDGISYAITTKIIHKGDELLVSYGNAYWKELEMFHEGW